MTALYSVCAFGAVVSGVLGLSIRDPRDEIGDLFMGGFALCVGVVFGLAAFSA